MEIAFSKTLGQKVKYHKPLFVTDLDLRKKVVRGGGKNTGLTYDMLKNKELFDRVNIGLRRLTPNAVLIIRRILLSHAIEISELKHYVDFQSTTDATLDQDAREALNAEPDVPVLEEFGDTQHPYCIIRFQSLSSTVYAQEFIYRWSSFIKQLCGCKPAAYRDDQILSRAAKHKYRLVEQYTPRTTLDNNPTYTTYMLFAAK